MTLGAVVLVFLLMAALYRPNRAEAQYRIEGQGIRKAWGPLRSSYVDPRSHELRAIFEAADGTIRVVEMTTGQMTAASVVAEFRREQ